MTMQVRLVLCIGMGLIGWIASYPLMIAGTRFGYDVAQAEDYVNGASAESVLLELSISIAGSLFWFGIGLLTSSLWRRMAERSARQAPPN